MCKPVEEWSALSRFLLVSVVLFVTQLGWSGYGVLVKATTATTQHHVDPLIFSLLRDVGAVIVLLLAAALLEGVKPLKLKDVPIVLLGGTLAPKFVDSLFLLTLDQLLYLYGVYLANGTDAGIVQPLNPVLTCILSVLMGLESLGLSRIWGWLKLGGIVCSVGGTLWLVLAEVKQPHDSDVSRLMGSVLMGSIYIIVSKKYIFKMNADGSPNFLYPPITATAYMSWFATLELSIAAFLESFFYPRLWEGIDTHIIIPLMYAIFIASALCYALLSYANSLTTPTVVTSFWPLQSLLSILLSWLILHEKVTWLTGVCGGLIIIGLFCVCFAKFKEDQAEHKISIVEAEEEGFIQ